MADWSKPTLTSTYTNFLTELSGRLDDAGKLSRSDTVTLTNPPVGTIRWNTTSAKWQTNTGTVAVPVWSDLAATYGISISGNAATATTATSATSATTATTATNQSGGTVSATTLAASGAVTLTGGTANGVPYLNGSKVLTSGTALVFDGANLGVGVTPSASWGTSNSQKAFQIGPVGALSSLSASAGNRQVNLSNNAIDFNGTPTYLMSDFAATYRMIGSTHSWSTAPSGTAGNAISFTQAMTLDANGNLGVGYTAGFPAASTGGSASAGVVAARSQLVAHQTSMGVLQFATADNLTQIRSYGATAGTGQIAFQVGGGGGTADSEAVRINAAGNLIAATSVTGHWQIPRGTTAQRPTGASGMIRFNSTVNKYEGHNGTAWANIGGGATGGGTDDVFVENGQTVNTDYTITTGKNAMSAGPITIASGITVTVPSGSTWVVV